MKILLGCFRSNLISDYLIECGHDVTTCDILPALHSNSHLQGDLLSLDHYDYDFLLACPPCQYLTKAQGHRFNLCPDMRANTIAAVQFVKDVYSLPVARIALENPPGHLNKMWRYPSQLVRPYYFGDPYQKEICLWLKNVPPLMSGPHNPKRGSINNHVNGRMDAPTKSGVRSSWNRFPCMVAAMESQWFRTF